MSYKFTSIDVVYFMPIENVNPGGPDNLQFNRTKKSLLTKQNKHLQSLATVHA